MRLLGFGPSVNFRQLVLEGAIILDVRSAPEYAEGHIGGAINIPVEQLRQNLRSLLDKQAVIIACCTNGKKSWYAKNLLDATGYQHVYNGGSWTRLQRRLIQ